MESAVLENRGTATSAETPEWREAEQRVAAYLAAWKFGDTAWARDCAREIIASAQQSAVPPGREIEAAVEHADEFLKGWFEKPDAAEALLFGEALNKPLDFCNRAQIADLLGEGQVNMGRARVPARPPETRPMTMQTSLSRLPSIRLIAGWIVLVALLFLVFVLTHR